ncbi:hypothetical protein, partial [Klebsiella pneumoniae]|uniref:hypothetical protein n=1 Tax=Klebsiella pneumoniae TaxID=573 RepID=UPI00163D4E69
GFIQYRTLLYKSMNYFSVKYEEMTPAADEVAAYFEENAAELEANGAGKDAGKTVDVRQILISPEGGTKDEEGNTTYSEDEWAACLAEAERVY